MAFSLLLPFSFYLLPFNHEEILLSPVWRRARPGAARRPQRSLYDHDPSRAAPRGRRLASRSRPPPISPQALQPGRGRLHAPTAPGKGMAANGAAAAGREAQAPGGAASRSILPLTAAGQLQPEKSGPPVHFRLAPVGRSPEPGLVPIGPGRPPGLQRFTPGSFRPGTAPGGDAGPGGVFLLPFDIRERAVADWTEAVLSRIERNWIIPASGRLAFSGRVQITLTIERQGGQRSLVVDDASVARTADPGGAACRPGQPAAAAPSGKCRRRRPGVHLRLCLQWLAFLLCLLLLPARHALPDAGAEPAPLIRAIDLDAGALLADPCPARRRHPGPAWWKPAARPTTS